MILFHLIEFKFRLLSFARVALMFFNHLGVLSKEGQNPFSPHSG